MKRIRLYTPSQALHREFGRLLMAWTYFTRVPLPQRLARQINYTQQALEKSVRYLSLFGIAIGALAAIVFWAHCGTNYL